MASSAVAGASEEDCNNNDSCIIEIPEKMEPELTCTENIIYRVPRNLRKLNEAAYTPSLISIGPFHHGKRELKAMERHKKDYYEQFCERPKKSQSPLFKKKCEEVRKSYAGTMNFYGNELEEMILIDACFIIELFLKNYEWKDNKENKDYILKTPWLKKAIQLDLILLENQLPYLLLEDLYDATEPEYKDRSKPEDSNRATSSSSNPGGTSHEKISFLWIAYYFFKDFCRRSDQIEIDNDILIELKKSDKAMDGSDKKMKKIKHFTDLVRQFRLPSINLQTSPFRSGDEHLYSATELDKAGVGFVVNDGARLTDVKLTSKWYYTRLELPKLMLDDATELLFRNMIALEQCLYSDKAYICSYVALMRQLIKTKEDADFLVEKKIIKNMSSQEEAHLFTRLSDEISFSNFFYALDCETLNDYCENWLNRTLTKAKKVYFNDLWKTSATVVGFFVLLFTITSLVETIFFPCV